MSVTESYYEYDGKQYIPMQEKSVKMYKQTIPINIYHMYITGEIEEVDKYIDAINEIKLAEEHDTVFIYLNTQGGNLSTAIQIISAMQQSKANIVTVLEGEVSSAGTMIFLAGDQHIVNDNCSFMIHNYSHGPFGKGNEVAQRVKFTEEYFKQLANYFYKDFLTDDEIENVCEGKDIWLGSEEVRRRLNIVEKETVPKFIDEIEEENGKTSP